MTANNRSLFWAAIALRVALAASFLSAVADRFGLWGSPGTPGVGWGAFEPFLAYTGKLLWFLPPGLVLVAGWTATVLEVVLAVALLAGVWLRAVAFASGVLLATFAVAMTAALGPEPPLSYSVWTAAAGAFLLAALPPASRRPTAGESAAQVTIR
ncbi:DoxX family protein [Fimbriiglobus ruber]|uniref:DoxX family protein n=1 Tax=Fimbriiglobus ruber TaxID=1908690 RepID=A0A225E4B3_9BACT|nr:DoxX family protein [Fimbriiglobus ruber]OWK45638.1 hypothetical protein FRUB_01969 [Fimbriiglobus ruber]